MRSVEQDTPRRGHTNMQECIPGRSSLIQRHVRRQCQRQLHTTHVAATHPMIMAGVQRRVPAEDCPGGWPQRNPRALAPVSSRPVCEGCACVDRRHTSLYRGLPVIQPRVYTPFAPIVGSACSCEPSMPAGDCEQQAFLGWLHVPPSLAIYAEKSARLSAAAITAQAALA